MKIWDIVAGMYDPFETVINRSVYENIGVRTAGYIDSGDTVLECACGTGAISRHIAKKCRRLAATDMSVGMLRVAEKNCRGLGNVSFFRADIAGLKCGDDRFDKVVAGNVIHLLDDPYKALKELERVCKPGGKIIVPTYINSESQRYLVKLLGLIGVEFKREFDLDSYKRFFEDAGYKNVSYSVVEGRMPCALAIINV